MKYGTVKDDKEIRVFCAVFQMLFKLQNKRTHTCVCLCVCVSECVCEYECVCVSVRAHVCLCIHAFNYVWFSPWSINFY